MQATAAVSLGGGGLAGVGGAAIIHTCTGLNRSCPNSSTSHMA